MHPQMIIDLKFQQPPEKDSAEPCPLRVYLVLRNIMCIRGFNSGEATDYQRRGGIHCIFYCG